MKAKTKLKDGVIKHGKVEMTDEELELAQSPKIRTTIFLDADLIRAYKKEAAKRGLKYVLVAGFVTKDFGWFCGQSASSQLFRAASSEACHWQALTRLRGGHE
jgi:hypothetical protein